MPTPTALTGAGNVTTGATPAGTSVVANKPASVADNDLLVALVYSSNTSLTFTAPSGWTQLAGQNTARSVYLYSKPIPSAAAESATNYTWSWTGSARGLLIIGRVTNADLVNPLDVAGTATAVGTSSIAAPSLTSLAATTLLLACYWTQSTAAPVAVITGPASMVTVGDVTTAPAATSDLQLGAETLYVAGASGTRTATVSPAAANAGAFLVSLRGTPDVPASTMIGRRVRPPGGRRPVAVVVPAQVLVSPLRLPTVIDRSLPRQIRSRRARQVSPVPAQAAAVPPGRVQSPGRVRRTVALLRRGVEVTVVPAQQVVVTPPVPLGRSALRRVVRVLRRPEAVTPVPAQVVVASATRSPSPGRVRRVAALLRRPEVVTPVPAQVAPPAPVDSPRPLPRAVRLRRPQTAGPVPTQVPVLAPALPPRPARRRILAVLLRRGRRGGLPVQPGSTVTVTPKAPRMAPGTRTGAGSGPGARPGASAEPAPKASAGGVPGARPGPTAAPGTRKPPMIEGS